MKKIISIVGLHCAVCGLELQEELAKVEGVEEVHVDFAMQKVHLTYEGEGAYKKALYVINHFEKVKVVEGEGEEENQKGWIPLMVAGVIFLLGIVLSFLSFPYRNAYLYPLLGIAYVIVGTPVLISTVKNVAKGHIFDENFLMTIASIGAILLGIFGNQSGVVEGVAVMYLYSLGEYLQGVAVGSSRRSVKELLRLKSERAYKKEGEEWIEVSPEQLIAGDIVLVKAGERVPVDGKLVTKMATIDSKPLTGEAEWKEYRAGDELLSGNINAGKPFELEVIRPYEDSAVKKIVDLVENATTKKAKPEKFISKFAKYYTPAVCLLALFVAVGVPLLYVLAGGSARMQFPRFIKIALEFLVISCPCALIISVPLSYFGGIGALAKHGILAKGSVYLDVMAKTDVIALDKTGTVTEGNFTILKTVAEKEGTEEELLEYASALESQSAHPLATAFSKGKYEGTEVEEVAGKGLKGMVNGKRVLLGNSAWMQENSIPHPKRFGSHTTLYMAVDGVFFGYIEIGDNLREDAVGAIKTLQKMGKEILLLTGDKREKGEEVARALGVSKVESELLPMDKLEKAEELKKSGVLMYVGDGINDAPVMASADCGVSMGKLGSAVAVETSDLVLVSDRLSALPEGLKIAKKTRKIVLQNIIFSLVMKGVFMLAGALGMLELWMAVFGDVGVMLLAVLNALRIKSK